MPYFDKSTGKVVYGENPAQKVSNALAQQPQVTGPQPYTSNTTFANANRPDTNFAPAQAVPQQNAAARVTEALNMTKGNTAPVNVPQNNNNNQTTPSAGDQFKQGYDSAVNAYKSNQTGNNMDEYKSMEQQRTAAEAEAIRARVRAAIQQGVSQQQKIINDAPAQFVDPMNRASFQGAKNLQATQESMARRGRYFSGDMDNAEMQNRTATQNDINALENTKAQVISNAQQAIANLQAQGSLQEVQQIQEAAAKSLERLQAQQNIIENRANQMNDTLFSNSVNALKTQYDIGANERQLSNQDRITNANITGVDNVTGRPTLAADQFNKQFGLQESNVTGNYNGQRTLAGQTFDNDVSNTKFNQGIATAGITGDYNGQRTLQGKIADSNLQTEEIQRKGLELQNTMSQYKIDKLLPLEYENAKQLIQIGRADLAAKEFANSVAPEEFKMKMAQISESIAASKDNRAQGWEQINIAKTKTANASSGSSDAKSPYFDAVSKQLADTIGEFKKNTNIVVPESKYNPTTGKWEETGGTEKNWITTPGSQQYNQVVSTIMNAPLQPWEKKYLLDANGIPYK